MNNEYAYNYEEDFDYFLNDKNGNPLLLQKDNGFKKPNDDYKEEFFYSGFNFDNKKKYINTCTSEEISTKENLKNDKEYKKELEEKKENKESDKIDEPIHKALLLENLELNEIKIKNVETKKKCGRKRGRTEEHKTEHNKFSDDNLRRKCKHLVLKYIMEFLNYTIKNIYNGYIGNGIFKKELQTLNQWQVSDATIEFNKNFLSKKLVNIFSENISGRYTNYRPDHNKILIKKLLNEKDSEKQMIFDKMFNLEFIQCMRHFRGEEKIDVLEGLKCFSDIKDDIIDKYEEEGVEYYETLKYYLDNFEKIINNKRARKLRNQNAL